MFNRMSKVLKELANAYMYLKKTLVTYILSNIYFNSSVTSRSRSPFICGAIWYGSRVWESTLTCHGRTETIVSQNRVKYIFALQIRTDTAFSYSLARFGRRSYIDPAAKIFLPDMGVKSCVKS